MGSTESSLPEHTPSPNTHTTSPPQRPTPVWHACYSPPTNIGFSFSGMTLVLWPESSISGRGCCWGQVPFGEGYSGPSEGRTLTDTGCFPGCPSNSSHCGAIGWVTGFPLASPQGDGSQGASHHVCSTSWAYGISAVIDSCQTIYQGPPLLCETKFPVEGVGFPTSSEITAANPESPQHWVAAVLLGPTGTELDLPAKLLTLSKALWGPAFSGAPHNQTLRGRQSFLCATDEETEANRSKLAVIGTRCDFFFLLAAQLHGSFLLS